MWYWCLCLNTAATTFLDVVRVIRPIVDTTVCWWLWTNSADFWRFIHFCRFSQTISLQSLSDLGKLLNTILNTYVPFFHYFLVASSPSTHIGTCKPISHNFMQKGMTHDWTFKSAYIKCYDNIVFLPGYAQRVEMHIHISTIWTIVTMLIYDQDQFSMPCWINIFAAHFWTGTWIQITHVCWEA